MLIPVKNNLTDYAQYSYLAYSEVAGSSVLRVKNINSFSPSWAIQIGQTGQERSEIQLLSSSAISGTSLTINGTLRYDQPTDTPVYAIKYDQIVFMRSIAGTAGTAIAMTDGTVSIKPDSLETSFDDTTAASTFAYKTKFRNSVTGEESTDSDWITPAGLPFYSLSRLRERTRGKLRTAGTEIPDEVIDDSINEWYERMNAAAIKVNEDYSLGTANISFGTSGLGTITQSDFIFPTKVWVTYDGVNTYQATKQKSNDYSPLREFSNTHPYVSFQSDNVFKIQPSDTAGTAKIEYQKLFTPLTSDSDELPNYMRNYSWTFVKYAQAMALGKDEKWTEGDGKEGSAIQGMQDFISSIVPRLRTNQTEIDIVEPLSGEDL